VSILEAFFNAAHLRNQKLSDLVEQGAISPEELRTEEFPFLPLPPRHRKASDAFKENMRNVDFHATAGASPIGH